MRLAQARDLLSATFPAQIRRAFLRSLEHQDPARRAHYARALATTPPGHPGHDPRAVPAVPAAVVSIRRHPHDAGIIFSYKVEYGQPPHPALHVRPSWLTQVVHRGHVVLAGLPVLDVLDRDAQHRPTAIRAAVVRGHFDPTLHGWRASAHTHEAEVGWTGDTPTVVLGDRV